MKPIDLITAKRQHATRLANERGAAGETLVVNQMPNWVARPRGPALKVLLAALRDRGITLKPSSFDAIALPEGTTVDFTDPEAVRLALPSMTFIEIKTSAQARVQSDFSGFFFALTESEIAAAELLGDRHRVALYNKTTGDLQITSVPAILARARSTTWQVSVQL